ncbi:MAG: CHC2 zinc finger domain-containing protein, partial [Pseudomonadota bacterium]|nr:CHC2 zinc finger domain-containing protein [Pseudomonadota bacterium]
MRFTDQFIDELKGRLRPSDVIGRTVKLKRQGREYVGLSPFSKEKSPSFFVNDDKGFFHDFSS